MKNFSTSFSVDQSPTEVFNAINNVRGWWSQQIDGVTDKPNAEFLQHYQDIHICKLKITEFIPGEQITWHVLDSHFNFTKDETEWKDTTISFEISKKANKTQVKFTHYGLVPQYECYDICKDAWTGLIKNSLRSLITTGQGNPNEKEKDNFKFKQAKRWKLSNG